MRISMALVSRSLTMLGTSGFIVAVSHGCTPSSETTAEPCSNGPAWSQTTKFAVDNTAKSNVECTPRCAWPGTRIELFYTLDALPSGPCKADGDTCSMEVRLDCVCGGVQTNGGPVHGMFCSCDAGQWACKISSQGAAVCVCPCDRLGADGKPIAPGCDAGADAQAL